MGRRLEGIVTSACAGSDGKTWELILFLAPWREAGGAVNRRELRVLVPMKSQAAASRSADAWDGKTVGFALASLEPPSKQQPYGLAMGRPPIARVARDAAFEEVARQRAKPRHVDDPALGKLTLDRQLSWYEGTRRTAAGRHRVAVEVADPDDDRKVARAVGRAGPLVAALDRDLRRLLDAIADDKLDLYNGTWRDRAPRLSRTAFKSRLSLTSIVVAPTRVTAYFDCDGLFTDHVIEVRLSTRGQALKLSEICLAG